MKKIFTLIAAAVCAVSASAQAYTVSDADVTNTTIAGGTTLIDNDYATVKTVYEATAKDYRNADDVQTAVEFGDKSFINFFQLRSNAVPTASNLDGGEYAGSTPVIVTAKKEAIVKFYIVRGATKTFNGYDQSKNAALDAETESNTDFGSNVIGIVGYRVQAGKAYTFYTKGGTTKIFAIDTEEAGAAPVATTGVYGYASATQTQTYDDGATMKLNKDGKAYGAGKGITVLGKTVTATKGSNGAENVLTLPQTAYAVRIFSYINAATNDLAQYWSSVGGTEYVAESHNCVDFNDVSNYLTTPDDFAFSLGEAGSKTVSFTNKGTQNCFVVVAYFDKAEAEALTVVTNPTAVISAEAAEAKAPVVVKYVKDGQVIIADQFNAAGAQVK